MSNIGIKEQRVGDVSILVTDGKVRIALRLGGSSVSLLKAVDSLLEKGHNQILLNLDGVAAIDARGLGELVSSYIAVEKSGGQFKLFNLTQMLRELITTTKLLTIFDIYESESQALSSFTHQSLATALDSRSSQAERTDNGSLFN